MRSHNRQLFLLLLALLISFSGLAASLDPAGWKAVDQAVFVTEYGFELINAYEPAQTPAKTEIITIPLVEKNSGERIKSPAQPVLLIQITESPPGPSPTVTPTPLPPQTGTANLPIVFGASAIILILLAAWLFIGWRPKKSSVF